MANTSPVYARIDAGLKENAEDILYQLGISPSEAIKMLYSQIVLVKGMPFESKLPAANQFSARKIATNNSIDDLLGGYIEKLKQIYGDVLTHVILYGSYARGDYNADSDIDIMILLNLSSIDIKAYSHQLSEMTYDYNFDHDLDIKPIALSEEQFRHWLPAYPFYQNVDSEGVTLYAS